LTSQNGGRDCGDRGKLGRSNVGFDPPGKSAGSKKRGHPMGGGREVDHRWNQRTKGGDILGALI